MFCRFRYKPSKTEAREFAAKMNEIDEYCDKNGISHSLSMDSYYFEVSGQKYRVSNHSVESSKWHDGREKDVFYIHASKTRLIEIHKDILAGVSMDHRGRKK